MIRLLAAITLALLPGHAMAQAGQGCIDVRFARGAYSHVETGTVLVQPVCYFLAVSPGQSARVRLLGGNATISTNQTVGSFQDIRFTTRSGQLFVYVTPGTPGVRTPFSIEFAFI